MTTTSPPVEVNATESRRERATLRLRIGLMLALGAVAYLGASVIYRGLTSLHNGKLRSDVLWHNQILIESQRGGESFGYTIYYWILLWLAGGDLDPDHLRGVAVVLLSTLMAVKLMLTFAVVEHFTRRVWVSLCASVALLVMVPIDLDGKPGLYLGKFSGTIWHNSTTALLIPLSVLVFFLVYRYLSAAEVPPWLAPAVALAIAVNAAAKPNYMLVLIPAAGMFCLWLLATTPAAQRARLFVRLSVRYVVILAATAFVLVPVYLGLQESGGVEGSRMGLRPFAVWEALSSSPVLATVESFLLPALITSFLGRVAWRTRMAVFAWLGALFGVLEFVLLAEVRPDGTVLQHGNWIWGAHAAMFLLQVVSVSLAVKHWSDLRIGQRWAIFVVVTLQLLTGVIYLTHLFSGPLTYT